MYYVTYGNKYNAKKTEYNGRSFDSKLEASHAMELEMMKKAGKIKDYECQKRVEINVAWYSGKPTLTRVS